MVEILVMGNDKNYNELGYVSEARIRQSISEISPIFNVRGKEEDLLKKLKSSNEIPASQLRPYGSTIPILRSTLEEENMVNAVKQFFIQVEEYATEHNAPYVLIQNLTINVKWRSHKVWGLAQLLITN